MGNNSLDISKLSSTTRRNDVVAFTEIGSRENPTVAGFIDGQPELGPDRYGGPDDVCMRISIREKDGVVKTLFCRRQLLSTVADAVLAAGTNEIEEGGYLVAWLASEKPSTRGGSILQKAYGATYRAPEPIGQGVLADNPWGASDEPPPF
jgi:hypothetical protein